MEGPGKGRDILGCHTAPRKLVYKTYGNVLVGQLFLGARLGLGRHMRVAERSLQTEQLSRGVRGYTSGDVHPDPCSVIDPAAETDMVHYLRQRPSHLPQAAGCDTGAAS